MSQKKTIAEHMISPRRQAMLEITLAESVRRIVASEERIAAEQERLVELKAEKADVLRRLDQLHHLREEAQA